MFGLRVIKVKGHSMEPAVKAGSFVLAWERANKFQVGDIIVLDLPGYPNMIKRISSIEEGDYKVEGDNKQDSLNIPAINKNQILGKVIWSK